MKKYIAQRAKQPTTWIGVGLAAAAHLLPPESRALLEILLTGAGALLVHVDK